jgi:photosystem II stability/assembly factor-like uncharacterized protein
MNPEHRREIEDALRASLERNARQAPPGDLVAERTILRAGEPVQHDSRRRPWRTWALPVLAAGAVAAVVLGLAAAGQFTDHDHEAGPDARISSTRSLSASSSVPTATSSPASGSSVVPPTSVSTAAPNGVRLTNFKATDLTFYAEHKGYALGTADCLSGPGRCTAILRTADGKSWGSTRIDGGGFTSTPFNIAEPACADVCVDHIRFANEETGYVYGPSAFFMTNDGGKSWQREPGTTGAVFLETLNQNVIRVVADPAGGCPAQCGVRVETSDIGSTSWTPAAFSRAKNAANYGFSFARGGPNAYLLFQGHNGTPNVLYRSVDNGNVWKAAADPCGGAGGSNPTASQVTGGDRDRVSALCYDGAGSRRWFVATSDNAGRSFTRQAGVVPATVVAGVSAPQLTGNPATVLVVAGQGVARSTDGGRSWQASKDVSGQVSFIGFESQNTGRAVTDDGRRVWTTTDAGVSWTPFRFPS